MNAQTVPLSMPNTKMSFSGNVGDMGSLPDKSETTFVVQREFSGDKEEGIKKIRSSMKGVIVLSESCGKTKDGAWLYVARCMTPDGGIPDFRQEDVMVKRFVGSSGTIPFFDGVMLYEVKASESKPTKFIFVKWIQGEIKHCGVAPEFTFTEDTWDGVCNDFRKQEQHILARSQRK